MANSRFYSSTAQQTTLTGGITPSDTTMAVASTAGFPGSTPYTLAVDFGSSGMELVEVTGVASLTLTIIRAIDGTSGASHSVGAIVRHVASARDFTDSRTHEAAIEDVHGLTGGADVVGTTSTQTLTNKTLSGGTISGAIAGTKTFTGVTNIEAGGNLAGTFTGTPTFSDGVTITGSPTITNSPTGALTGVWTGSRTFNGTSTFGGTIQSSLAAATTVAHATILSSGDTFDRFRLFADGDMEWGSGAAARDTNLFRTAADTLRTDDSFQVGGTLSVTGAASTGALTVTGNEIVTGDLSVTGVGAQLGARKTADQTVTNSTTQTNDTHMLVSVAANAVYTVEAYMTYNALAAADVNIAFTVPAGATGSWTGWGVGLAQSAQTTDGYTLRAEQNTITQVRGFGGIESGGTAQDMSVNIKGLLTTAGTAGTFQVQWAQRVANAQGTIMRTDSWIRLNRIA